MKHPLVEYARIMREGWLFVVSVLVFGSCTQANPAATCKDGTCSDRSFPYCDTDGSVGGEAGTCVSVTCTPGEIKECRGDMAFTCSESGNGYKLAPCDLGCSDAPMPHCKYLQPKYMPNICDERASEPSLTFANSGTFDPNLDTNCNEVLMQAGGPAICVVHYNTISVATAATLTVAGTKTIHGRGLALVADDDLEIAGTLDVGAHSGANGPGGGVISTSTNMYGANIGGAGAGGATPGGCGATSTTDGGGANAGAQQMNPALLPVLVGGGSFDRAMADDDVDAPVLGGGGGALALVSCHATVRITGIVAAGGGGGFGGFYVFTVPVAGGGGGAGGNVVMQGARVEVTGSVFANGGGGGCGATTTSLGLPGQDGPAEAGPGAGCAQN
ncbi:MAG: hypothetical protein ABI678_00260, partial [Kofleriaceae bacterium]